MKNDDKEFLDKLTPIGRGIYKIGEVLMGILAIICLVAWIKEGVSFWDIVIGEFTLLLILGLIVLAVVFVVDVIIKFLNKL